MTNKTHEPPKKRSKRHRSRKDDDKVIQLRCYISHLPVEILAEILGYIRPYDLLAMARTSKYFCAMLVSNRASTYIWKEARARFKPQPIPDPTPNFTESSYAAFLFDEGICEVCGAKTKEPYVSYSLRLRICKQYECRVGWRCTKMKTVVNQTDIDELGGPISDPLLPMEINSPIRPLNYVASTCSHYRREEWFEEVDARNKVKLFPSTEAAYRRKLELRMRIKKPTMELCRKLLVWRAPFDQQANAIKMHNLRTASNIAKMMGIKLNELHHCPSFILLYRSRTSDLDLINLDGFMRIRPLIERELEAIHAEQKRRVCVHNVEEQQEAVLVVYKRLKSRPGAIVPPLNTFRKLPFVRRIAGSSTSSSVSNEIRDSTLITKLAEDDVREWVKSARKGLNAVLGGITPDEARPTSLPPVDRLTALFRCKKCDSRRTSWPGDGTMSFTEACAHQCVCTNRRPSRRQVWNAERFVPDLKAIDAVKQVLMWCGFTTDDILSLEAPEEVGTRIQCLSCSSHIIMTYNNLFSHCYRHESMQLKLLSVQEVSEILQYPIKLGRRVQLTAHSEKSQTERQRQVYGCRHCEQKHSVPSESVPTTKPSVNTADASPQLDTTTAGPDHSQDGTRGSLGEAAESKHTNSKSPKLFKFDGLRSHVKEKHGILWVGDEDFFEQLDDESVTLCSNTSPPTPSA